MTALLLLATLTSAGAQDVQVQIDAPAAQADLVPVGLSSTDAFAGGRSSGAGA